MKTKLYNMVLFKVYKNYQKDKNYKNNSIHTLSVTHI